MIESAVERAFCKEATARGLLALKYGVNGWPDRMVLLADGTVAWVELKRPGETLRALQERRRDQLTRAGQMAYVLDTVEKVNEFWRNR